jgi:hypothetical protein
MIGNFMTEAIYPTLLHQDPRYFRRGTGSTWSRLGYAMGQIFITHGDNRRTWGLSAPRAEDFLSPGGSGLSVPGGSCKPRQVTPIILIDIFNQARDFHL